MGEIFVRGPRALDFVQLISCNDHGKLAIGRAQYTGLMYPQGTFVDDLLVHRVADDEYLLVVNAANTDKDSPTSVSSPTASPASRSKTSPTAGRRSPSKARWRRNLAAVDRGRPRRHQVLPLHLG